MPRAQVGSIIKVTRTGGSHNYPIGMVGKVVSTSGANCTVVNPVSGFKGNSLPEGCYVILSDRTELATAYKAIYDDQLIVINGQVTELLRMREKIELLAECETEEDELNYIVKKTLDSKPDDKKLVGLLKTIVDGA